MTTRYEVDVGVDFGARRLALVLTCHVHAIGNLALDVVRVLGFWD